MGDYLVLAASIAAGLLAGLFFAFAVAVMPALRGLDDPTFVDVMNRINVAIVNPVFVLVFFGAPALTVAAVAVDRTPILYAAGALAVGTLLITLAANIPLNNRLAAGAPRADFENAWVRWNLARTVTAMAGFVCLLLR